MKKIICLIFVMLISTLSVFAGSIPEDLLGYDYAQLFFAKVEPFEENAEWAHIMPTKVIKGDVKTDIGKSYSEPVIMGDFEIEAEKIYLVTYYDEINPTYIFETTTQETKTLKLKHVSGDMWERFEEYLNNGEYEKAEKERKERAKSRTLTQILDSEKLLAEKVSFAYKIGDADGQKVEVDKDELFEVLDSISCNQIPPIINSVTEGFFIHIESWGDKQRDIFISKSGLVSRNNNKYASGMVEAAEYKIKSEDMEKLYQLAGIEKPQNNIWLWIVSGAALFILIIVTITIIIHRKKRLI